MTERGETKMANPKSKAAQIDRLKARLQVATGRGTETYRASLEAQIDALTPQKGVQVVGEAGPETVKLPAGAEVKRAPS